MAFISDILIDLGKKSNPKSNMSMAEAGGKMLTVIQFEVENGLSLKKAFSIIEFSCKELNKAGFKWFEPSKFFTKYP